MCWGTLLKRLLIYTTRLCEFSTVIGGIKAFHNSFYLVNYYVKRVRKGGLTPPITVYNNTNLQHEALCETRTLQMNFCSPSAIKVRTNLFCFSAWFKIQCALHALFRLNQSEQTCSNALGKYTTNIQWYMTRIWVAHFKRTLDCNWWGS